MFKQLLGLLFGSNPSQPVRQPPTEKQVRYAHSLGIKNPASIDRVTLSQLIGQAEARNPKQTKRGSLQAGVAHWERLADASMWMLVVFTRGKSRVGQVVRINGAIVAGGKLKIETEILKVQREAHIGEVINPGRYLAIVPDKIIWSEIVNELDMQDVQAFQKLIARVQHQANA